LNCQSTKAEDELRQNYLNLTSKEQELVQTYNEKYGVGSVNIETGEFTPIETEATPTDSPKETVKK
jgi:hypothetical protein